MQQDQFLDVIDRDEAEQRFHAVLDLRPLAAETIALSLALGRILAEDVIAPIDVPSFDRSNVDGFAVRRRGHVRSQRRTTAYVVVNLVTAADETFRSAQLGILPLQQERYDFVTPRSPWQRSAIQLFRALLEKDSIRAGLRDLGFDLSVSAHNCER